MGIKIVKPGLLTSVQDMGRRGYQKYGVITSGVMDFYSAALANIIVGNDENEGVLEINFIGPTITFTEDCIIALAGSSFHYSINSVHVPERRPVYVKAGSVLEFGFLKSTGCRAYMAVCGGFNVTEVMGSKSTYLKAGIGGYFGRALQEGDFIPLNKRTENFEKLKLCCDHGNYPDFSFTSWYFPALKIPAPREIPIIRVTKGPQFDIFPKEALRKFFTSPFQITNSSDRMGYRLDGDKVLLEKKYKMISEAVTFGSVQVPADGNPIILLADRQTTGGYPKIAQVALADLPIIAQLMPGRFILFKLISLKEAESACVDIKKYFSKIKGSVSFYMNKN